MLDAPHIVSPYDQAAVIASPPRNGNGSGNNDGGMSKAGVHKSPRLSPPVVHTSSQGTIIVDPETWAGGNAMQFMNELRGE